MGCIDILRNLYLNHHLSVDNEIGDVATDTHASVRHFKRDVPLDEQASRLKLDHEGVNVDRLEEPGPQRVVNKVRRLDDFVCRLTVKQTDRRC